MLFSMCLNHILHIKNFFADRCPVFYIPGIPQAELSYYFPNLSFSLAALSFECGQRVRWGGKEGCFGLFVAYPSDYCCYELTTICQTRKKPHRKPPPITKKNPLHLKCILYDLLSSEGLFWYCQKDGVLSGLIKGQ